MCCKNGGEDGGATPTRSVHNLEYKKPNPKKNPYTLGGELDRKPSLQAQEEVFFFFFLLGTLTHQFFKYTGGEFNNVILLSRALHKKFLCIALYT